VIHIHGSSRQWCWGGGPLARFPLAGRTGQVGIIGRTNEMLTSRRPTEVLSNRTFFRWESPFVAAMSGGYGAGH